MYEIVKNRPVSEHNRRISSKEFPFEDMDIGDSFYIKPGEIQRKKFSVMVYSVGKRLGRKFATRGENGGLWVQRIK